MTDRWEGLRRLIDEYWSLAYAEGKEGRTVDTPAGDAQRVSSAIDSAIADLLAERDALERELAEARRDAARIDWIEAAARRQKIELARSILGTGFEIGEWPEMRVTVRNGSLRAAIDRAMERAE